MRFSVDSPAHRMLMACLAVVFAVSVLGPGVGLAKLDMEIHTGGLEGDPGDGLEGSGGGSSGGEDDLSTENNLDPHSKFSISFYGRFSLVFDGLLFVLTPDGKTPMFLIYNNHAEQGDKR